jgi:hypothetical protein
MFQDDVPTAFLKGDLKEEIYMAQVPGFPLMRSDKVLLLLKTLYGLKQSPREWNEVIASYLLSKGFETSKSDPCIFHRKDVEGVQLYVGVYVDDIVTTGSKLENVQKFRDEMMNYYLDITEGGPLEWYLGVRFTQTKDGVTLDQQQFLQQKLKVFEKDIGPGTKSTPLPNDYLDLLRDSRLQIDTEPSFPYRQMVGSLMYAMTGTRPAESAA